MFYKQRIWFCLAVGLILCFYLPACVDPARTTDAISLEWQQNRATGMIIPRALLGETVEDPITTLLRIHLAQGAEEPPVFGEYLITPDSIVFRPLIPFTSGLSYDVRLKGQSLGTVTIPAPTAAPPGVTAIFPSSDTLPENLLKVYLQFSKPMRTGQTLQHILLTNSSGDTLRGTFLDLQTELWNSDQTMLTLWLDPGRIKRGLQPNDRMGTPLRQGERYQLTIENLEASDGSTQANPFIKRFLVAARDSLSPVPSRWTIGVPEANTRHPLRLEFHETLDYALLHETVTVHDAVGSPLSGTLNIVNEEKGMLFTPGRPWKRGVYTIALQSRLEDAAGNNLDRPFDAVVTANEGTAVKTAFDLRFRIE